MLVLGVVVLGMAVLGMVMGRGSRSIGRGRGGRKMFVFDATPNDVQKGPSRNNVKWGEGEGAGSPSGSGANEFSVHVSCQNASTSNMINAYKHSIAKTVSSLKFAEQKQLRKP